MHILIGLVPGCVLLYFWLAGHWFARVLMLPVAAISVFLIIFVPFVANSNSNESHPGPAIFALLIALCAAWPIASAPIWYWRRRIAEI